MRRQILTSGYEDHVKYISGANWSMTVTHCNGAYFVSVPARGAALAITHANFSPEGEY